jgi:hypothetical protein
LELAAVMADLPRDTVESLIEENTKKPDGSVDK